MLPAGASREAGVVVRRFPVRLRDTRRHAWLQQRILRGSRLRPKEEARWAEESVGSTELFDHLTRRQGDYDLVCFAPYLFGTTLRGVPLVPGRAVLIPCLHDEPFAHLGVVREAFQACRGFIFNSPPEAALAEKLYGIGDRPGRRRGARLRSGAARPTRRRSAGGTASRGPSSSTSAGRRRGRTSRSSSSTPSATAPSGAPT